MEKEWAEVSTLEILTSESLELASLSDKLVSSQMCT